MTTGLLFLVRHSSVPSGASQAISRALFSLLSIGLFHRRLVHLPAYHGRRPQRPQNRLNTHVSSSWWFLLHTRRENIPLRFLSFEVGSSAVHLLLLMTQAPFMLVFRFDLFCLPFRAAGAAGDRGSPYLQGPHAAQICWPACRYLG